MEGYVYGGGGNTLKVKTLTETLTFQSSYRDVTLNKADIGLASTDKIVYADTQVVTMDDYTGLYLETTYSADSVSIGFKKINIGNVKVKVTIFYY